jgi:hypothetical protein
MLPKLRGWSLPTQQIHHAQVRWYNKASMLKSTIIPNVRMPDFPMAQETREPDADSIVDLSEAVDRVAQLIEGSRNKTIVLTGAGASTDSGIPDYRSPTVSISI